MVLFRQYDVSKTKSIELVDVIDRGSQVAVTFLVRYQDGTKKVLTSNVKTMDSYVHLCGGPSNIPSARALGSVYLGILKTDGRTLFVVKLHDGTSQLIQVKENSWEYRKLLEYCYE